MGSKPPMDPIPVPIDKILVNALNRYPAMQVQDIYKLLYQAALGSEHGVVNEKAARKQLELELAGMGAGPDEPLEEPISPDGQIVRIHLRSWLGMQKAPEALLTAFLSTAREWCGTKEVLEGYAQHAAQALVNKKGSIRQTDLETFFSGMEAKGFPAVHHSDAYRSLYRPAYRVVARKFLEDP